jgi:Uma2 family endonuclease
MGQCWYAPDMAAIGTAPSAQARVQPLESGDRLGAIEFLRRYEAMPEVKKAELIEGTVYMPSPVRLAHAAPDTLIQTWLGTYAARTPGTQAAGNVTVRLDPENVPQPDALLRILPECGGQARVGAAGYLFGPPELIVEVAASSVAIDLHDKLRAHRRAGVREYLVWRTLDGQLDWFVLDQDDYRSNAPAAQGVVRSPHFPGLALAADALLDQDAAKVLDVLQIEMQTPAHAAFVAQLAANARK